MSAPKLHIRIANQWGSYDAVMMDKLIMTLKANGLGVRVNDCTRMHHNLDISAQNVDQLDFALKMASVSIPLHTNTTMNTHFIQWAEGRKPHQETFHRWFNWDSQTFFSNPTPWKR